MRDCLPVRACRIRGRGVSILIRRRDHRPRSPRVPATNVVNLIYGLHTATQVLDPHAYLVRGTSYASFDFPLMGFGYRTYAIFDKSVSAAASRGRASARAVDARISRSRAAASSAPCSAASDDPDSTPWDP